MIEIKNLSHSLGNKCVLSDISIKIKEGTILGLVGINGAGKSTLLRCMTGVYVPDGGDVIYDGKSIKDTDVKNHIFFLPDDPYYTMQMSCKDMFDMYSVFYPNSDKAVYKRLISEFDLDDNKPLRNFSKGMRRQAYIVCALAICPKYLLLDEAFDGLDPYTRKKVKNELIRMVEERNTTVVISSHSLMELESFCDSYALLNNNTIASTGDISDKTGEYCKFQLAFLHDCNTLDFSALPVVSIEKSGKFVKLVLKGSGENMYNELLKYSPAIIEEMKMDFEEAVISEIEGGRGNE